jgi:site-specific recombinase XerD
MKRAEEVSREARATLYILQEILDHSRISNTLDTYSHVTPHMQREALGRFGRMFSKPS